MGTVTRLPYNERHAIVDFARYTHRPVLFVKEVLGADADPWQRDALTGMARGRNIAARSGHGVGKTACCAWVILWWLVTRPDALIPCTAPTQHQLFDVLWPEIARWINRSPLLAPFVRWTATRVSMRGADDTWFATARAAAKPENLAGFHAKHLLYVVDEASGVPDILMAVVDGALTTEGARLWMGGNPTRPEGYFATRFTKDDPRWRTLTVNAEESPRVSGEWCRGMADEWGADSDTYRVRVLGLPPRGDPTSFIPYYLVQEAIERTAPQEGVLELGVDVARYGDDKSCICAKRGLGAPLYLQSRHGLGNPAVVAWILDVVNEHAEAGETVTIRVDDDGVGGGVTDLLRVISDDGPLECGATIDPDGRTFGGKGDKWYSNQTGVMYGYARRMLHEGKLALPDDPELARQLTQRTSTTNERGKIVLEKKEHMKARGLASPDKADAWVLAYGIPHWDFDAMYGVHACSGCGHQFVRNAETGWDRPCPQCRQVDPADPGVAAAHP